MKDVYNLGKHLQKHTYFAVQMYGPTSQSFVVIHCEYYSYCSGYEAPEQQAFPGSRDPHVLPAS